MNENCNICGHVYQGLAADCPCTIGTAYFDNKPPVPDMLPTLPLDPIAWEPNHEPEPIKPTLSEAKMAIANAVEDYASAHLHAFITHLINLEYMTEPDVLKALERFDESLQASPTQTES